MSPIVPHYSPLAHTVLGYRLGYRAISEFFDTPTRYRCMYKKYASPKNTFIQFCPVSRFPAPEFIFLHQVISFLVLRR